MEKDEAVRQPIVTPIVAGGEFWPAEDYHQDYYKKNPVRYKFYATGCGRYARLDQLWGKLDSSNRERPIAEGDGCLDSSVLRCRLYLRRNTSRFPILPCRSPAA